MHGCDSTNRISLSTGWLPRLENRPFYEFASVIRVMKQFSQERLIDGFEFGLLPEWDEENPPLTPTSAPPTCEKHSVQEILGTLRREGFPILSVHASRDVGSYICSKEPEKAEKGLRLMEESLRFCRSLGSSICVFHLWDPWKGSFDPAHLLDIYNRFQRQYSDIEISIENIPTTSTIETPFQLMRGFEWVTLDLKWASMFNEFERFLKILEHVDNVHIQGKHQNGTLIPTLGKSNYDNALKQIISAGYSGPFTIELEGKASFEDILNYVRKLRKI